MGEAVLLLSTKEPASEDDVVLVARRLRGEEKRRRAGFSSRLERAADDYLVRRGDGRTIVAGYPWFTDWGRDTFIALRGPVPGHRTVRRRLRHPVGWSGAVSEGMLPNRFPEQGGPPEYNSVDASLWYVIAVHELTSPRASRPAR